MPHREHFWNVPAVWAFYVAAAAAVTVCLWGVIRQVRLWHAEGRPPVAWASDIRWRRLTADGLFGRRIWHDPAAGVMHTLLQWGFFGLMAGTVLSAVDNYFFPFLYGRIYLVYAATVEAAGLALLAGLIWAVVRRTLQRVARLENRPADWAIVAVLGLVALTGFLVEQLRLAIQQPSWPEASPVGHVLAAALPAAWVSRSGHAALWWVHAILSLGLVAWLPFSKLFHAMAAPANLALGEAAAFSGPAAAGSESGSAFWSLPRLPLDACTTCGRCNDVCPPAAAGETFAPRAFLQDAKAGKPLDESVRVGWHCTTCGACREACPVGIVPFEHMLGARATAIERSVELAPRIAETLDTLFKYQNPSVAARGRKNAWARTLSVPDAKAAGAQATLYFAGCTTALDPRLQSIARATVTLLRGAGADVATFGKQEPCCGDIARHLGERGLFEEQARATRDLVAARGITSVVASSPHCFHTMRRECEAEVLHHTEFLARGLAAGHLALSRPVARRATYHDPCYLGRHNGVFDAPRRLLGAIPGLTFTEMPRHGAASFCCGGGGGRMWQEFESRVPISELRLREAIGTGSDLLVTSCPECLTMLEAARKAANLESAIEVLDISELLLEAMPT